MRLVVLVSGNGSNLQAIIDACAAGRLSATVVGVIGNRRDAFGLERARRAGIADVYHPYGPYKRAGKTRMDYDADLAKQVMRFEPDVVVLAGWMLILSSTFIDCIHAHLINLHPALPDCFPGINAIERAFEANRQGLIDHTGVMVHHVVPEVDAGPVIATDTVPILSSDHLEDLEARIHATEHRLLIDAIASLADSPTGGPS